MNQNPYKFRKHLSLVMVILSSGLMGINLVVGNTTWVILMGLATGLNAVSLLFYAKRDALTEEDE